MLLIFWQSLPCNYQHKHHLIDVVQHNYTKDTWVTVILWQEYYTNIHTDSVTYVNAKSSFFLLYCADFIIYALYM